MATVIVAKGQFGFRPNNQYQNQGGSLGPGVSINLMGNEASNVFGSDVSVNSVQLENSNLSGVSISSVGNKASNIFGGGNGRSSSLVNSIYNPSSGGSTNVIGNRAENIFGGQVNSVIGSG